MIKPTLKHSLIPPLELTEAGEAQWTELADILEWAEGFELLFIYSDHHGLNRLLVERSHQLQSTDVLEFQNLPSLAEDCLIALQQKVDCACSSLLWLKLDLVGAGAELAIRDALMRLNERREYLRRHLNSPLIILLPTKFQAQVPSLIPDLWSVRSYSCAFEGKHLEAWMPEINRLGDQVDRESDPQPGALSPALEKAWRQITSHHKVLDLQEAKLGLQFVEEALKQSVLEEVRPALDYLRDRCPNVPTKNQEEWELVETALCFFWGKLYAAYRNFKSAHTELDRVLAKLELKGGGAVSCEWVLRVYEVRYSIYMETGKWDLALGELMKILKDLIGKMNVEKEEVDLNFFVELGRQGISVSNRSSELYLKINNKDDARKGILLSEKIFNSVSEKNLLDVGFLYEWSETLLISAGIYFLDDKWTDARDAYGECVDIRRALLQRSPEEPRIQAGLAAALEKLGYLELIVQSSEAAIPVLEECLEMRRRLIEIRGQQPAELKALASVLFLLESAVMSQSDLVGYEHYLGERIDTYIQLLRVQEKTAYSFIQLAGAYYSLHSLLLSLGRTEEASRCAGEVLSYVDQALSIPEKSTEVCSADIINTIDILLGDESLGGDSRQKADLRTWYESLKETLPQSSSGNSSLK